MHDELLAWGKHGITIAEEVAKDPFFQAYIGCSEFKVPLQHVINREKEKSISKANALVEKLTKATGHKWELNIENPDSYYIEMIGDAKDTSLILSVLTPYALRAIGYKVNEDQLKKMLKSKGIYLNFMTIE